MRNIWNYYCFWCVVGSIVETFKKGREAGHAIIVIDELDLLIDKDRRVVRALQESLDGVESSNNACAFDDIQMEWYRFFLWIPLRSD